MAKLNESNLNDIDESIEHKKINVDVFEDGNKTLESFAGPEQIVCEGSTVFLDGHSFPSDLKLFWKQIDGPAIDLIYKNGKSFKEKITNPRFIAPYITIDFDDQNTIKNSVKKTLHKINL